MKPAASSLALVIAALGLCSCRTLPQTHYYVLEPQDMSSAEASGSGVTIGVEFQVDPIYDQDRIVYRIGEDATEVGFYAYHRWAAPLARMLPGVVAAGLTGVGGVKRIEPATQGRDYDAYLYGRVLAFEEIDTHEGERILVRLSLNLLTEDGRELWVEMLDHGAALSTDDVRGVVEQMRAALDEGLRACRPGLERALLRANGR